MYFGIRKYLEMEESCELFEMTINVDGIPVYVTSWLFVDKLVKFISVFTITFPGQTGPLLHYWAGRRPACLRVWTAQTFTYVVM